MKDVAAAMKHLRSYPTLPINVRAGMAPNAMGERNVPIPPRAPFSKRTGPDWHYAYPDGRNVVIRRLLDLLRHIDFGNANARGFVTCRIPLEIAVQIQKELADVL